MSSPLRVLQVNKLYPPALGGVEAHVRTLSRGLARAGCEVTVVCANERARRSEETDEGVRVIRLPSLGRLRSAPIALGLAGEIRASSADVIHVHFPYPPAALALLSARVTAPIVVTWHSDVVRQKLLRMLLSPVLTALLRRASRILATSDAYLASSEQLAPHRDLVSVVPLGIEPPRGRPLPEAKPPAILCVGRLVPYKGHAVLLDALARLPRNRPWQVWIVGGGPLEQALHRETRRLGLKDRVSFLGEISDAELDQRLRSCRALVLPSIHRSEAFGLVQLEASSRGKPVVSTALATGVPEVNRDGRTGLVVPPGDAAALASALEALIRDPARARRLGLGGESRFRTVYTAEAMVRSVLAIYRQALERHAR